ncbi:uncharacterized protein M2454_000399 [Aequitasia blattaphilus]|uniref:SEC-C metal-binding domain-containing protein n=1 Tax=Aequitasia blattaphilus TaxID=2949332 RepID=A0ABT1E5T8_9FIRM|nr:SEC-C metal-binding domain-containing protein [Aequitasia blattaphilus]MCP1101210.1 SEC-C metal-binding domain-containing protein [Aequitasia blattaphilus]MCR8613850.1 SEC-C metal-binding domain-containing protein [Aequitasia blattaphilus]
MAKSLYDQWQAIAYNEEEERGKLEKFWENYFESETAVYEKLLSNPNEKLEGSLKDIAEKVGLDVLTMVGFLDGINDSLITPNDLDTVTEDTIVNLIFDEATLYKNMVDAKAEWLYELPEWDDIFTEEEQKALYKEQKESGTIRKDKKIGRNDPCPCGSGKKYKKCCGK